MLSLYRSKSGRAGVFALAAVHVMAGMACVATVIPSIRAARADRLRAVATPANVAEAIRLDPLNPYAYTLRADLLEQSGRFGEAEHAWREALRRNPRDAEAWMRTALLLEQRGATAESERSLLQATKISQTWLPRWSLLNFYARQGRKRELFAWSRAALERASDDVQALFPVLQQAGASGDLLSGALPKNRSVLAAWLDFELQDRSQRTGLEQDAVQLATLIPQTEPGWPGAAVAIWPHRSYPVQERERDLLLAVVDRLLEEMKGAEAVRLWNLLMARRIISGTPWTSAAPVANSQFRFELCNAGFDWRAAGEGTQFDSEAGEFVVRLDGHQAESFEPIKQRAYIPGGVGYRFVIESRTESLADDGSLQWRIVDPAGRDLAGMPVHPSEDWSRGSTNLAALPSDRVVTVVLTCRRPLGSVRAQGAARFRLVSLEQAN